MLGNLCRAVMGRVYSRDPDIFLTQSKLQRRNNNIHRRPESVVHHTGDDFILGNLKFIPKGESVEVFGMAIPDPLITEAIQQSSYYPKYLEMVAENTKKTPQESASVQPATKRATPKKPTATTPKVRKGKPTFQLVDEDDEAQQESLPQEEGDDPDLELAKKMNDFILGNLKFVPKGETVEVFGMAIPDPLITEAIQQSSYYPKYLKMVAENTKKTPQESASVHPATKKGKPTFQLVDEDDEAQQESVPQEEGDDPDIELAKKMILDAH
ncbi:hypothetical protein Tco_1249611 [Tanacetum coccineum]